MKAYVLLGALLMAFGMPVSLFGEPCRPVEIRNLDGNSIISGVWGDIPYSEPGGARLSLDAYVHQGVVTRPAVIVIHGGSWTTPLTARRTGRGILGGWVTKCGW